MCDRTRDEVYPRGITIPVEKAVGTILAHDITEIRRREFKGCAFRKGHIIREKDLPHLRRLGKENLFVLNISPTEMHEDEAACRIAKALMAGGIGMKGEPREGKIDLIAETDGILKVDREALLRFNMLGEVMCATLHDNTVVRKGQVVAGTRAIPLVVRRDAVEAAVKICGDAGGIISVRRFHRPRAGIVITGNEVYYGRIQDAFGAVITKKVESFGGVITGLYYAPDDQSLIEARLRELIGAGADMLIITGGMSVDPDDVTRFAVRKLGAVEITYGSAALPGSMFLVAYLKKADARGPDSQPLIPVLGVPACGMYHDVTVFDLIVPRILSGEHVGRKELAELGHGGLCLKCEVCKYPVCPFGK